MAHFDADLRHMTSAGHLSSQRSPNRQRLGSRSPNSIPSSPTSVHSSSSAIFERDIEPIIPASPPFVQNPHRIPRAKGTEQLEHAVPSVLDSAASVLAGIDESPESAFGGAGLDHVSVVSPAPAASTNSPIAFESILARSPGSGFASPIGSFRSRSPSPLGLRVAPGGPGGVVSSIPLLSIPPIACAAPSSHSSSPPPISSAPTNNAVSPNSAMASPPRPPLPAIITPISNSPPESSKSSPTTATACEHTATSPPQAQSGTTAPTGTITTIPISTPVSGSMTSPTTTAITTSPFAHYSHHPISHPPSPTHGPTKRLSFMSYSDLLSSTPTSTLPLSSLTTSCSSMDPPPHIPSVNSLALGSPVAHGHGHVGQGLLTPTSTGAKHSHAGSGSATTSLRGFGTANRDSIAMSMDDVGGEWEREGLGRGLEERLEALIKVPNPPPQVLMRG